MRQVRLAVNETRSMRTSNANPLYYRLRQVHEIALEDVLRALYYGLTNAITKLARSGRGYDRLSLPLSWVRRAEKHFGPGGTSTYMGHLRRVFPRREEAWRKSLLADYWRNHQRRILGLYHTATLSPDRLSDCVEWSGLQQLRREAVSGQGVLLLVPHYGDERTLHILLAMAGLEVHVLTSRYMEASPAIRERRLGVSRRWNELHFPDESPSWMPEVLKSGGVVHFAPTCWGGVRGEWLKTFGVPVLVSTVPERLWRLTECRIFLGWNTILPGMRYRIELEPFEPEVGGRIFNRSLFERIEAGARRKPRQYDWMNLVIRHRETNTMVRLGGVPRSERTLEERAIDEDWNHQRVAALEETRQLPRLRNETGGTPVS